MWVGGASSVVVVQERTAGRGVASEHSPIEPRNVQSVLAAASLPACASRRNPRRSTSARALVERARAR
eukprot:31122-Pelagococcus_subviridis.AAC.4